MIVQVYRNLTKNVWSLRHRGKVIEHRDSLTLLHAEFKVSEKGRQRVIREGRKNVHAYVKGELLEENFSLDNRTQVSYNPYKSDSFYRKDTGQEVDYAHYVQFNSNGTVNAIL